MARIRASPGPPLFIPHRSGRGTDLTVYTLRNGILIEIQPYNDSHAESISAKRGNRKQ